MAKQRKTIAVSDVVDIANVILAAPAAPGESRVAICCLVERVLMDTGNYKGFRYLDSEYASTQSVNDGGAVEVDEYAPLLRKGYDKYRRQYH